MRTRIKEKSFTPVGFEPKTSGIDYRHSTNWATRPSWEQVSIRWPISGQTLNCVWWCNRCSVWWYVESGSSCHRRNEERENHGGLMPLGLFLFQMNLKDVFLYYGFKATKWYTLPLPNLKSIFCSSMQDVVVFESLDEALIKSNTKVCIYQQSWLDIK